MIAKINKILLYIIPFLAVLLLVAFLLKNSFSYSDLDLGWHLQVGSSIIDNHQISQINKYNYTLHNYPWIDHEWLANALMAYIYSVFGSLSLQFAFLLFALIAFYVSWKRSLLMNNSRFNKYLSFAILFFGFWASQPHLGIRVQEFGLIGVGLLLLLIDKYPRKKSLLYFIPLLFLLWTNIHASFILGLGLFGLYCLYLYLGPYLNKLPFFKHFSYTLPDNRVRRLILFIFVLSLGTTLINPYGIYLYSFLGGYSNAFYMSYIREWQGQFSLPLVYSQIIYLSLSATCIIIWVWFNKQNKEKISLWHFGLFILFFMLAWRSRRHFPLFVVTSLPLLALFYQEIFKSIWDSFSYYSKVIILSFFALSSLLISFLIIIYLPLNQHVINSFCDSKYPCAAVDYLKNHPETEKQRIFSEYNWGGYLIWSYQNKQLFIDGRMPQVSYNNHSILEEYLEFRQSTEKAKQKLDEYQIDLVLIKNKPMGFSLKKWEKTLLDVNDSDLISQDELYNFLYSSDEWQIIFRDNLSSIYGRK